MNIDYKIAKASRKQTSGFGMAWINAFVPNGPFLYPLKISESPPIFWCFQKVEKGCIESKWVNWVNLKLEIIKVNLLVYASPIFY